MALHILTADKTDQRDVYDMLEQGTRGEPICISTLSNHCRGPFKCISIQHGVLVTVCLLQSQRLLI